MLLAKLWTAVLALLVIGIAAWYFMPGAPKNIDTSTIPVEPEISFLSRDPVDRKDDNASLILDRLDSYKHDVLGTTPEGQEMRVYRFGNGARRLAFVGAIHGGYEWNTALLSYQLIDHFTAFPEMIPSDVAIAIIPVANPDGLYRAVGSWDRFEFMDAPQFKLANEVLPDDVAYASRFNANGVDINRNFDCDRTSNQASWRQYVVDAGPYAFSEPETQMLRDFFINEQPLAAVFYHSASNGVYLSQCDGDPLPGTVVLRDLYGNASGYPKYDLYTHYEITGAGEDWLASQGIPAITVDLSTHDVIEWEQNFAGVQAMLEYYSEER